MKPTVGATTGTARVGVRSETLDQEREPYAWLGDDFASYYKEIENKRATDKIKLPVSKRLQQKLEATGAAHATPRWSMQGRDLREVALGTSTLEQERATGTMDDP